MKRDYIQVRRDNDLAAARIGGGVTMDVTSGGQFSKVFLRFGVVSNAGLHANDIST